MTDLQDRSETDGRPPVPVPAGPKQEGTNPWRLAGLAALVLLAGVAGGWPILAMILAIVVMIFLHELGHFLTAKWAGMKVTEFFIGFGPRIWSFRRGETEYGLKVIPAGAYVKIIGMHNLDEYDPADADRTYMSKPYWRRLSVAVAGSTMHFLLAIVSLFVLFSAVGVPGGRIITSASEADRFESTAPWVVGSVSDDTPADRAGIREGDAILAIDGQRVSGWGSFTDVVQDHPGDEVDVVVRRDGEELHLPVTLASENPSTGEHVGFLGVSHRLDLTNETLGVLDAAGESVTTFGRGVMGTFEGLGRILSPSGLADLGNRVVSPDEQRAGPTVGGHSGNRSTGSSGSDDADRPVSIVGVTRMGADLIDHEGWGGFLSLFVILNIFIGIFNLVPLLPLDGGHVAIATYEKIRSMLRRGEPYHVDVAKLLPLTYAVVLVLGFVFISTVYLDLADPIGG